MRGDLNQDIGLGQIKRGVGHFGHENRVHFGVELEVLEDLNALALRGRAVDVGLVHFDGVVLEGEDVVGEDDGFVAAALMVADQVLGGLELLGVHHVEQQAFAGLADQILAVEFWRHRAPHFGTLHAGDKALFLQFKPVGLVQFGADQEVQVGDFIVLS